MRHKKSANKSNPSALAIVSTPSAEGNLPSGRQNEQSRVVSDFAGRELKTFDHLAAALHGIRPQDSLEVALRREQYTAEYGTGANGKSVFLSTLAGLLGDYARTAPVSDCSNINSEDSANET